MHSNKHFGILFLAMTALPLLAADVPEALQGKINSNHDRQIANSMDFLLTLQLSKSQAREILAYHEDALERLVNHYIHMSDIYPEEIEAYTDFLEEDRLNQGFSRDVERRTARIHHEAIHAQQECNTRLNEIAQKVEKCLTPQQKRLARDYKPTMKALKEYYTTDKDRKKQARRHKRNKHHTNQYRPRDVNIQRAQDELHEINAWVHHGKNPIAAYLLTPAASSVLYDIADRKPSQTARTAQDTWYNGTKEYPMARLKADQEILHTLKKEINNWNLTNGLHFSPQQIEALVDITRRTEYIQQMQRQAKPRDKMPIHNFHATLVSLEREAEAVLNPGQLEVLVTYNPCLMPPKNLKNPVRVGQANDNSRVARWLDKARKTEDEHHLESMIDRAIQVEIEHFGPLDQYQEAERRKTLQQTVARANAMTDVEYALEKDDLVAIAAPPDRKQELKEKIDQLKRERLIPGRTKQFILNRDFANVLIQRHDQLANGVIRDGVVVSGKE